jgi:predicted permease
VAGPALLADLEDGCAQAHARGGRPASARYAARQFTDLLRNLVPEWRSPTGPRLPGRRQSLGGWVRSIAQDAHFAVRSLRRDPLFATTVIAVVGLGMAALITVYGMVESVLLEPLPYPNASRLVSLTESYRSTEEKSVAYPNYLDWRDRNRSLGDLAARNRNTFNLTGQGNARTVDGMGVSANLFDLLGVAPLRGRTFSAVEATERARVVVLAEGFWQQSLGGDPEVVGQTIQLDGDPFVVVGIVPTQPEFPLSATDLWLPLPTALSDNNVRDRTNHPGIEAFGVLREGVDLAAARADLDRVAAELAQEYPDSNLEAGVLVRPLRERIVRRSATTLWVLLGAVSFVMLGICANVASLMLARATRRRGEIAIRAALGAGRRRLARQILAEGVVLCGAAGAVGLLLAVVVIGALRQAEALGVARQATWGVDTSVAAFAMVASLLSGAVVTLASIYRMRGVGPAGALRGDTTGRTAPGTSRRARGALVVVQVALAVLLMTGAGLMLRSLENLARAELGLAPGEVLSAYVGPPQSRYPGNDDRVQLFGALAERARALPGVRRVAGGWPLPMSGSNNQSTLSNDGFPQVDELGLRVDTGRIMPGYFDIMGIRLLEGRDFREDDTEANRATIIDRTLAAFLFGDGPALGQRVRFRGAPEDRPWFTVVGVVDHVKNYGVRNESRYELYLPYTISAWGMSMLVEVESAAATETVVAALRAELNRIDPELPLTEVVPIRQYIDGTVADEALLMRTLTGFAAAALLVAVIGLYGVIAYSVTLRTREFGIRMALGAARGAVLRKVILEGAVLAGVGVVLGIGGALAAGRWLSSLLYGVPPTDPVTLVAVVALMGVVALLASALPARQAVGIDPSEALRG